MSHGSPVPSLLALSEGDTSRVGPSGAIGPAPSRMSPMAAVEDPGPYSVTSVAVAGGGWAYVAYGNGVWVACRNATGTTNVILRSTDGLAWALQTNPSFNPGPVAWGNGIFVVVNSASGGTASVMTSPDGITWTVRVTPSINIGAAIVFANGIFVVGSGQATTSNLISSVDGITWTQRTGAKASAVAAGGLSYGAGVFVVAYTDGSVTSVASSPDGITWTSRTTPNTNINAGAAFGNGVFVVVQSSGVGNRAITSPDGITWTARTTPATDLNYLGVVYGNGLFVGLGNGGSTANNVLQGEIMLSADGINWRLSGQTNALGAPQAGLYAGGLWTFVGSTPFYTSGTSVVSGHCTQPNSLRDTSALRVVPTTGSSIAVPPGCGLLVLAPAGLLATLTVALPATPAPWEIFVLAAESFGVTALTLTGTFSTGAGITTIAAGGFARWIYDNVVTSWVRIG